MNLVAALFGAVGLGQGSTLGVLPSLQRLGMARIPRERRRGMSRRAYRHGVFGGLRLKEERRRMVRVVNRVRWTYGKD